MRDLMFGFTGSHRCLRHHLPPSSSTYVLKRLNVPPHSYLRLAFITPKIYFYCFFPFLQLSCAELERHCGVYHPCPTWPPRPRRFHRAVSTCFFAWRARSYFPSLHLFLESVTSAFRRANVLVISFVLPRVAPLSRNPAKSRRAESGKSLMGFRCQRFSRLRSQRA